MSDSFKTSHILTPTPAETLYSARSASRITSPIGTSRLSQTRSRVESCRFFPPLDSLPPRLHHGPNRLRPLLRARVDAGRQRPAQLSSTTPRTPNTDHGSTALARIPAADTRTDAATQRVIQYPIA